MEKMNVSIKNITKEMLVSNIRIGKFQSVIDQIKSASIINGSINYVDFEAVSKVLLVQASLKDEYIIEELQSESYDIYDIYDSILSNNIYILIFENIENLHVLENIISSELKILELEYSSEINSKQIVFEEEISELIINATNLIKKLQDKKYTNSLIKTAVTNAPKELVSDIKNIISIVSDKVMLLSNGK